MGGLIHESICQGHMWSWLVAAVRMTDRSLTAAPGVNHNIPR